MARLDAQDGITAFLNFAEGVIPKGSKKVKFGCAAFLGASALSVNMSLLSVKVSIFLHFSC